MTKATLRAQLANDDLDQVIQGLLRYAEQYASPELRSTALILSGRLEEYKQQTRIGATAYEALSQQRAAVRKALLDTVEALPDAPPALLPGRRLPGFSEQRFKSSLFWGILAGMVLVLLWIQFQGDTGGFTPKEKVTTLMLLLAVFTAYLSPMFNEILQRRQIDLLKPPAPPRRLHRILPLLTWLFVLPVYFGGMFYFVHLRGSGEWDFDSFSTSITLFTTGFGAYVGMIVNALFKKDTL